MNYNGLRLQVFLRDGYRCVDCGGEATETHHIVPRGWKSKDDPDIWRIENMITLCQDCHLSRPGHVGADNQKARYRHLTYLRDKYGYEYRDDTLWGEVLRRG